MDAFTTPPDSAPGPPRTVRQERDDRKRNASPLPPRRGSPIPRLESLLSPDTPPEVHALSPLDSEDDMLLSPKKNGPDFMKNRLPWWEAYHILTMEYDMTRVHSEEQPMYLVDLFYRHLYLKNLSKHSTPKQLTVWWSEFADEFNADSDNFERSVHNGIKKMQEGRWMELHQLCQESGAPCAVLRVSEQNCPFCFSDSEVMTMDEMSALEDHSSISAKIREIIANSMQ